MSSEDRNEPGAAPMPDAWPSPAWTPDGHVTEPTVHAWLDGALAPAAADAVAAHVASCAACGALAAEVRGVIAGAARVVALLDGHGAARMRVDGGGGGGTHAPPRAWYRRPAVLSLAATLLLAVGVRTVWEGGGRPAAVGAMAEATRAATGAASEAMPSAIPPAMPPGTADSATVAASEAFVALKAAVAAAPRESLAASSKAAGANAIGADLAAPMARRAPMAAAPPPAPVSPSASVPAPPPPSAPVARAMAAERVAAMAVAADAVSTTCLLVEAPQAAGITLPPRMRLSAGTDADRLLQWLWDEPRAQGYVEFRLRPVGPDSLAGADTRALGIRVTLAREGDGWRGTATAAGDGAPVTRLFRLRAIEGGRCER